jgi:hypothetical protein
VVVQGQVALVGWKPVAVDATHVTRPSSRTIPPSAKSRPGISSTGHDCVRTCCPGSMGRNANFRCGCGNRERG